MDVVAAYTLLAAFYGAYLAKLLLLRRRSIRADVLGKGQKPKSRAALEIALKCATYFGAGAQFIGVLCDKRIGSLPGFPAMREGGLVLMAMGVMVFLPAIATMGSNWRAGYAEGQNTELVTTGIYKFSRNPAFLGFDLLYVGCALAFPNPANVALTVVVVVLFHLQILGEERFLADAFGQPYTDYKGSTGRYLGTRKRR